MRQTLFYIPIHKEIWGLPLFGLGWLLAVWTVVSVVTIAMLARRQKLGEVLQNYLAFLVMPAVVIFLLPRLAESEGLPIRGFGVMLLLALGFGLGIAIRRARQVGLDPEVIISLAFWMFISGIVGARLFYVVQKWHEFEKGSLKDTAIALLNVTQGGLVVYGSVIAAAAALFEFCRRNRLPWLAICDLIAPALLVGLALGRVGCFLNGCCFGGVCDLPWAVTFPFRSPPYFRQAETGLIDLHGLYLDGSQTNAPTIKGVVPGSLAEQQGLKAGDRIAAINGFPVENTGEAIRSLLTISDRVSITVAGDPKPKRWQLESPLPRSLPVHPTQLYSTIDGLILALFLWCWFPFRRRDGEVTAWMLTLYPITRFLMESIRTDEPKNIFGMTISQNFSLVFFGVGICLWAYIWRKAPGTYFRNDTAA